MRLFHAALTAALCLSFSAAEGLPAFEVTGDPTASKVRWTPADCAAITGIVLEWLHPELPAEGEHWTHGPRTEGKFRRDRAGITQTWFALKDPAVGVLHLRADKPGALGFRIRLEGQAEVSERRRLTVTVPAADGRLRAVRAWVFPMESEVTPEERSIRVEGEGEALVLFTTAEAGKDELEDRLEAPLRELGFGGPEMPDLSKVWGRLDESWKREEAAKPEDPPLK